MLDPKRNLRPKILMPPMIALAVLWLVFGPHPPGSFSIAVLLFLFVLIVGLVCWSLFLNVRGLVTAVSTIGRPTQPRIFGIPKWKFWLITIAMLGSIGFVAGEIGIRKMVICQEALKDVQGSPAAKAALGSDLKFGWLASSSGEFSGDSGNADFNVSIRGSHGKGRLYATGVKAHGQWTITDLFVVENESGLRIEIAHQP